MEYVIIEYKNHNKYIDNEHKYILIVFALIAITIFIYGYFMVGIK